MPRAFIYIRVSSGAQADGLSLDYQARVCMKHAYDLGLALAEQTNCSQPGVFCDAASAFKVPISQRPGGKELLHAVHSEDTVIMYDISRGWRSSLDFAQQASDWVDMGVNLRFVAMPDLDLNSANGKLTASVLAAYAEWKSAILSERVRDGNAAKMARDGFIRSDHKVKRSAQVSSIPFSATQSKTSPVSTIESRAALKVLYSEKDIADLASKGVSGTIYGYVRVSTTQQSVESQVGPVQSYIENIVRSEGLNNGGLFEELGVSASKHDLFNRPEGKRMLESLSRGDHFVFLRPARAFRSVRDMVNSFEKLNEMGVIIHIAESSMRSGDVSFELCIQVMTLMAEIESKEAGRRRRSATIERRNQGIIPSTPNKRLQRWLKVIREPGKPQHFVVDQHYIAACRQVAEWRANERVSFSKCCQRLEKMYADETGRRPIPNSGVSPRIFKRWLKATAEGPAREAMQELLDRFESNRKTSHGKDVQPYYTAVDVERMVRDLAKHDEYLAAIEAEKRGEIDDATAVLASA